MSCTWSTDDSCSGKSAHLLDRICPLQTYRLKLGAGTAIVISSAANGVLRLLIALPTTWYLGDVLIDAGADTTKSFLQCLVLALLTFPAAQGKAHKEIDRIIHAHRIPSLGFESLPYLSSKRHVMILSANTNLELNDTIEVHRFRPVTPLSIPHAASVQAEARFCQWFKSNSDIERRCLWEAGVFKPGRYLLMEHGTKLGFDASEF
ncbi:hypothetical protein C8J56DRAFT_1066895 [Mycena floridula]|nr:hypothetical protein C8J56DRAFT_1066895 [Mycena floridula]